MEYFQRIDEDCAIARQPTPEQIQQLPQEGFKSVLNLRSSDELGALGDEQQRIEALGLTYTNVPVPLDRLNSTLAEQVLSTIQTLPKPVLIYCASARRASAIALMEIARRQALTPEQTLELGLTMGFDYEAHPNLKLFIYEHIASMQSRKDDSVGRS
jgi:uncharacterized protein (TIGR01244 family)